MPDALRTAIRAHLDAKQISARELSRRVGLNENAVSQILSGRARDPRRDTIEALAREMRADPGTLLGLERLAPDGVATVPMLDGGEALMISRSLLGRAARPLAMEIGEASAWAEVGDTAIIDTAAAGSGRPGLYVSTRMEMVDRPGETTLGRVVLILRTM